MLFARTDRCSHAPAETGGRSDVTSGGGSVQLCRTAVSRRRHGERVPRTRTPPKGAGTAGRRQWGGPLAPFRRTLTPTRPPSSPCRFQRRAQRRAAGGSATAINAGSRTPPPRPPAGVLAARVARPSWGACPLWGPAVPHSAGGPRRRPGRPMAAPP